MAASLVVGALVNVPLLLTLVVYVGISLLYCFWLKDEPVIDIAIVASGFLLRAIAGGAAAGIDLSQWFLLGASFGSLFMASGKRYAESADGARRPGVPGVAGAVHPDATCGRVDRCRPGS